MHGENDLRIPSTQAYEYYDTMRMKGVASKLVIFPEQSHVVTKPLNSLRWYDELFKWVKEYVRPRPE